MRQKTLERFMKNLCAVFLLLALPAPDTAWSADEQSPLSNPAVDGVNAITDEDGNHYLILTVPADAASIAQATKEFELKWIVPASFVPVDSNGKLTLSATGDGADQITINPGTTPVTLPAQWQRDGTTNVYKRSADNSTISPGQPLKMKVAYKVGVTDPKPVTLYFDYVGSSYDTTDDGEGKRPELRLLPFEVTSDLNNDGKAGEGSDSSLKTAALQSGASNDAKEKGTEYLFVNDQLSNGLWDKEDSDSSKPAGENKDDDVTELKTICAATWGGIWFEFEGGDISKLEFWKNKECTEAFTFDPTFALSESNKLPEKLYVRTKGEWAGQVEGKLIMKFGKADKSETWAEDKLLFTVVKWIGDSKFFHACRDYILENNTKFYATQKDYGGEKMRTVVMRQEATSMKAQDTFYRNPKLRGIDAVVGAFSGQAVIVNGNFGDSVSLLPPETTKCLGRLISGGALDTSMSLDSTQSSSVFASSNAYYVAQSGSTFTFAKGEVPLTSGYQEALGGLYRDYPSAESDASTMIGQAPVGDKKVIFVNVTDMNTSSSGSGNGVIGFKDDATTGSGATEVYLLDGSSSSALAYQKPDGTLIRQFKGSKHNTPIAFPYYIHTYLMFDCAKPRSN